jgi:pimeloyl-ACP methyl ester carboxylesterase
VAGPTLLAAGRAAAQAAPAIATEAFMVPAGDAGIELFVRNKRPERLQSAPSRTVLFVHGATYPAHTTFDLPLGGQSWMDYVAGRGFDVWCMDVRGYGRSTRPPEMAGAPEAGRPVARAEVAVADVAAVAAFIRQRRGVPKLVLFGWSWGTTLVGRFAADNPGLVERLVLNTPVWTFPEPPPIAAGPGGIGAYRVVTQAQARERWLKGVPAEKAGGLLPAGWFEHFAGVTWATDPEGMRRNPAVLRAPNGPIQDLEDYWKPGRTPLYDPARITVPTLLTVGEWDVETPPAMAVALFGLLRNAPGKRMVLLGEGTHSMAMERNRGALFQAVQVFLEEGG